QINGGAVSFPYDTNQDATSIGGACTSGDGEVTWSVSGAASEGSSSLCSSGTWSASLSPALSAQGAYTVSASQTNTGNIGSSGNESLTIADVPPTASFTFSPLAPLSGAAVSFDGSASSDPDGTIVAYVWTFGDGSPGATEAKTTHTYTRPGTFSVQLSV